MLVAAVLAAINAQFAAQSYAGLFKIDFGQSENERPPTDPADPTQPLLDAAGNPVGPPANLIDWTVIPTWTFGDPNANVTPGSASATGKANADGTEVTWPLFDSSANPNKKVTLTILDNKKLAEAVTPDAPAYMLGQSANNPTKEGIDVVFDGVRVPAIVKDDYIYRNPDAAGTESLMRIANLDPGTYSVTVFEGRTSDSNGRHGKIWVDDIKGAKEPAGENTGNYSGVADDGTKLYKGQPRTVVVNIKAGDYLWFAEMEDNSGGISGMIVRSVDPIDSPGLFKIDFGQSENERVPNGPDATPQVDADGTPVGAPPVLKDWNVIPTWTYDDPNANVADGSASIKGTANADHTEVTWKLTDFSKDANANVTLTIKDNGVLAGQANADGSANMTGMSANNPTKEGIAVLYDGVLVPPIVKDDYLYRAPDTAGTESLMRIAGLKPGKYNVTVFEGRTSDSNGRHGKVWVDDIKGAKEPAAENTGNYSGNSDGTAVPMGQPRTVAVEIKAGEFLWFAEMEDNSGGISGMIIRGTGSSSPVAAGPISIAKAAAGVAITYTGTLQSANAVTGPYSDVVGATSPYSAAATGSVKYFRSRQ
jgi:uncharacterized protein (DUF2141 family)